MIAVYDEACHACNKLVTKKYSTSFNSAIRLLHKDLRGPIHDIYGFVRFADEIVDTFHEHDKTLLLKEFKEETWKAIKKGISLNPILHSFQLTVNKYHIPQTLISSFLNSMELDLDKKTYEHQHELNEYIYGSAEVVGLMCLYVFCAGNDALYERLKTPARKLGAAFQKVNFLRDIKADIQQLDRTYFPALVASPLGNIVKEQIEADIEQDFRDSLEGIRSLPWKAKFGVYTAYRYYYALFKKIKRTEPNNILAQRIRVPDYQKLLIVMHAKVRTYIYMI